MSTNVNNSQIFKNMIQLYLDNLTKFTENNIPEFEVRFGTKKIKKIGKSEFLM